MTSGERLRLDHIDMLRGLACALVLCGHLRAFVFVNYAALPDPGIGAQIFYFLTGLGHQAVVVFFVLSGYLVGGNALDAMLAQRWSWPRYLLRRGTRLLIVVVPALVLTFVLDRIGLTLTGGAGYDGSLYGMYVSGPGPGEPLDHTLLTFLGNIAFVQTIAVPVFGTNGPMWSLANEFWYYIVFPLAASILLVPASLARRLAGLACLALGATLLPRPLQDAGMIWVAGAAAAWYGGQPYLARAFAHPAYRVVACLAPLGLLILGKKIDLGEFADLALGLAIAIALPALARLPSFGGAYRAAARGAAELSYTLYLTHFPLLALIVFASLAAPQRYETGIAGAALYLGLLAAAIAWAAAVWWCFERNTERVQRALSAKFDASGL